MPSLYIEAIFAALSRPSALFASRSSSAAALSELYVHSSNGITSNDTQANTLHPAHMVVVFSAIVSWCSQSLHDFGVIVLLFVRHNCRYRHDYRDVVARQFDNLNFPSTVLKMDDEVRWALVPVYLTAKLTPVPKPVTVTSWVSPGVAGSGLFAILLAAK